MIREKRIIVAFATMLLIGSCKQVEPISCELPELSSPPPRSNNLAINLYVDGTPSMEGYVANDTKSRYAQTLELLDSTFSPSSPVTYERLGTNIKQINREQWRDARLPKFYNGKEDPQYPSLSVSQIEKAIASPEKDNQLSVIITDLYQKDTDVTRVAQEIKNNYLNPNQPKPGNAVGILAIKSEFKGTVYTEDTKIPKFYYDTKNRQSDKYHPFYVIFLGKYSDIKFYFEKFSTEETKLIKESKLVIFAPYISQKSLHFSDRLSDLPKDDKYKYIHRRLVSIDNGKVVLEKNGNAKYIDLLRIDTKQNNEISLHYNVDFNSFKYTLLFDPNSVQTTVKPKDFERVKLNKSNDSSLKQAIEVNKFNINEQKQQVDFTTKIKPNLMTTGIYKFTVDITAKALQEQDWWSEWNSTDAYIKDGSKTYNLLKFLRELKNLTTDLVTKDNGQSLGRFCYAIQKS